MLTFGSVSPSLYDDLKRKIGTGQLTMPFPALHPSPCFDVRLAATLSWNYFADQSWAGLLWENLAEAVTFCRDRIPSSTIAEVIVWPAFPSRPTRTWISSPLAVAISLSRLLTNLPMVVNNVFFFYRISFCSVPVDFFFCFGGKGGMLRSPWGAMFEMSLYLYPCPVHLCLICLLWVCSLLPSFNLPKREILKLKITFIFVLQFQWN